jgi:hypothetical protein
MFVSWQGLSQALEMPVGTPFVIVNVSMDKGHKRKRRGHRELSYDRSRAISHECQVD